jgi:murein DD-endopeptidase MepM/ murein hydrolase activator NlpD
MRHFADDERSDVPRGHISYRWIILCAVALLILVGLTVFAYQMLHATEISTDAQATTATNVAQRPEPTEQEKRILEAVNLGASADDPDAQYLPTPLVANYGNLMIHTPILPRDITEIEFHQASYDTSLRLTPLVTIVDANTAADKRGTNHAPWESQPYGEQVLIAEAVSTWRLYSVGDEMTAVDVGAVAGKYAYAPVSGTVVRIKEYSLYGLMQDDEIHIQSPEYPELDIVVLHLDNLLVKVGDEVVGGSTRIGTVRSIGSVIDSNLSNFTAPGDPGDHCHVQVNDATREDYKGLEGALDIFNGRGYVRPEPPVESSAEPTVTETG